MSYQYYGARNLINIYLESEITAESPLGGLSRLSLQISTKKLFREQSIHLKGAVSIIPYMKYSSFILLVRILSGKCWNPFSREFKQERVYWKIFSSSGIIEGLEKQTQGVASRNNAKTMLHISRVWGETPLPLYCCRPRAPAAKDLGSMAKDSASSLRLLCARNSTYSHCPRREADPRPCQHDGSSLQACFLPSSAPTLGLGWFLNATRQSLGCMLHPNSKRACGF